MSIITAHFNDGTTRRIRVIGYNWSYNTAFALIRDLDGVTNLKNLTIER